MTRRKLQSLAAGIAIALVSAGGPAMAQDSGTAALEARVAELEAIIKELVDEKKAAPAPAPAPAAKPTAASTSSSSDYSFGGYIKLNAMFSDYSDGDLAAGSAGTQFYIPGTIPVAGTPSSAGPDADIQARESRINFKSNHTLASGDKLSTYVEVDFLLSPGGNERVSNSYNPRLRHAFFKYNNWTFGQTWSTFMDVGALPESVDFIGPSESTIFDRQPLIRYTNGPWEFAIENPETTITPFGGGSRIVSDDGAIPDVVARYTAKVGSGYIKAAAILRQLEYDGVANTGAVDDSETGVGLALSGKHPFGNNGADVRWAANFGSGIGRYLGLNTANDVNEDATGNLNAIDQWGAFVGVRLPWNSSWRSNFRIGYLSNDHDLATAGTGNTKEVISYAVNLLTSPVPKLTLGGEIMFAERTLDNNLSGDMTRFMIAGKYAF